MPPRRIAFRGGKSAFFRPADVIFPEDAVLYRKPEKLEFDLKKIGGSDEDFSLERLAGSGPDTVVVLHGWGVRADSMRKLAEMLVEAGYGVLNCDYPASRFPIAAHAEHFLKRFRGERLAGNVHILTHSMGGLVLRHAMAKMTEAECRGIDSIVMLGPPHGGSRLALFGKLPFAALFDASLGGMVPGSSALNIPPPPYLPPVGIIAGARDGKVAFESTALPGGLPFERVTVNCTHPGLRNPSNTGSFILKFMRDKHF